MRNLLIIAAVFCAGPVLADRAQATQLLVNNLVAMGGDVGQATTIARCFTDRMTDDQTAAFVAARSAADREAVLATVQDKDGASVCVQQAMSG